MKLYHFSEDPNITLFEPRQLEHRPDEPAMVWTIDAFHAPHYFFPRNCPRICIWPKDDTSESDYDLFFRCSNTKRMTAVEAVWYPIIRSARLYRYTFEPEDFSCYDPNAGYYTSTHTVKPVSVDPIGDLLGKLVSLGIEVRITPSLIPLRDTILSSTMNFSMIRMKNAQQHP